MKKLLFASVLALSGCAAPVPIESTMDWATFVASVRGERVSDIDYKTSTLKRSAYRATDQRLEQSKTSFSVWCRSHNGQAASVPTAEQGISKAFYEAASAWSNQELVLYGNRYTNYHHFCHDERSQQLKAVMLVRAAGGFRGDPYEPNKLPAPIIAFYTPTEAKEFADFYNEREKVRAAAAQKTSQRRSELQEEETRRLRATPKIGDKTMEGIVIDLRPPLALIQFSDLQRKIFDKPQAEWVPISTLTSPR